MVKAAALASMVLVLAACTPEPGVRTGPAPATGGETPPSPSTAPVATRDCATTTNMKLASNDPIAVAAGPVTFGPLDYRFGTSDPLKRSPDAEGWIWFKVAAFVRNGTRATVTIPQDFRDVATLTYTGEAATVAFIACDQGSRPESAFAGGFAVREPVCLPVDVSWDGNAKRIMLGFLKSC